MMMKDMKHTTGHQEQGREEEERNLIAEEKGKLRKGNLVKGDKYITIYIYIYI